MRKPNVAVIAVANRFESGGERGDDMLNRADRALAVAGMETIKADRMIWDTADALAVVDVLKDRKPDLLVIIHASWVQDSVQYLFVNNISCPVVLWAVPYMETYSLGCVQHFASIMTENGLTFWHVSGLPEDAVLIEEIAGFAASAAIAADVHEMRIGLIGPRDTWRTAGAQDMVQDEWDFSNTFGTTIVHVEIDELIDLADAQEAGAASETLAAMRSAGRIGAVEVDDARLERAARIYRASKVLFERYGLAGATAECYPRHGGLVNLASAWLADEGIILDSEGDIGHTLLLNVLYRLGTLGPAAMSEAGGIDESRNCLYLDHEGSSAFSLAEDPARAVIQECGDGSLVGFPFKPLPLVTYCDLSGSGGFYRMLIANGSTAAAEPEKWEEIGRLLLIKAQIDGSARKFFDGMIANGIDHHILVKPGDVTGGLRDFCDLFDVQKVEL